MSDTTIGPDGPTTPTSAITRHTHVCEKCGRGWDGLRTGPQRFVRDIRHFPAFVTATLRESPLGFLDVLVGVPVGLLLSLPDLFDSARCPDCYGRCCEVGHG
jgi:hypothetical protein